MGGLKTIFGKQIQLKWGQESFGYVSLSDYNYFEYKNGKSFHCL